MLDFTTNYWESCESCQRRNIPKQRPFAYPWEIVATNVMGLLPRSAREKQIHRHGDGFSWVIADALPAQTAEVVA